MWKNLAVNLPEIWQDKTHPVSKLLYPLSLIYGSAMSIRRLLFKTGLFKAHTASVPIIIVGNITVGGTGKTPFVVWLSAYLSKKNIRVGIISRGYGGSSPHWPVEVSAIEKAEIVGDEAVLLKHKTNLPVVVSPIRIDSANLLTKSHQIDIIISDDGLQHLAINRDLEIVIIDAKRLFGNNRLLPSGPLRESPNSIPTDAIKIYSGGSNSNEFEYSMQFVPILFRNIKRPEHTVNINYFENIKVNAIAGIGHPDKFFKMLKELNIKANCIGFADHHHFQRSDLHFNDENPIIMTEKDAVKCYELVNNNAWQLEIEALPSKNFIDKLEQSLSKIL